MEGDKLYRGNSSECDNVQSFTSHKRENNAPTWEGKMTVKMLETSEEMGPSVQVLHPGDESQVHPQMHSGAGAQGESSLHLVLTG